jgi:hypothetical protein
MGFEKSGKFWIVKKNTKRRERERGEVKREEELREKECENS